MTPDLAGHVAVERIGEDEQGDQPRPLPQPPLWEADECHGDGTDGADPGDHVGGDVRPQQGVGDGVHDLGPGGPEMLKHEPPTHRPTSDGHLPAAVEQHGHLPRWEGNSCLPSSVE